ncbi:hypothetical protein MMC29_000862 [Sticta canariensis]|nr:hypothetical protein [Sticta canariensis]
MWYHAKAVDSFLASFDLDANGRKPVPLRRTVSVWSWRLATLSVFVPQSYVSILIMRWSICWMLDVFGSKVVLSNIFVLLVVSVTRATVVFLALASVIVLFIHLLWNTVDTFIIRERKDIQEGDGVPASITEESPLLRRSRVMNLENPTPVVYIPDRRVSTGSSTSGVIINNQTPRLQNTAQCSPAHESTSSPPVSENMLSFAGDSPPDFNPYGISWALGRWNSISIMLWIRACTQASDDEQHLDRCSGERIDGFDPHAELENERGLP